MAEAQRVGGVGPGDQDGFRRDVEPFRRELLAHCYRMLGSLQDAEDAYQETLVRAWRGRDKFEGRSSFRTWLHRIATNACLDALGDRKGRVLPEAMGPAGAVDGPVPAPVDDPVWLDPYPDDNLGDSEPGPEARYAARETITIAFMTALHLLPARQRAVLLMRDVVGMTADETASSLETTVAAVNSALQRARQTLDERAPAPGATPPPDTALLARYLQAWTSGDSRALVALLRDDAILSMPPVPLWIQGAEAILAFYARIIPPGAPMRAVPVHACGAPAFAVYQGGALAALSVLTVDGGRIAAIHSFLTGPGSPLAHAFGLSAAPAS